MRMKRILVLVMALALASCDKELGVKDPEMEVLPYFDLAGFVDKELNELPDSIRVSKSTRVNGEQKNIEVMLSREELKKEFEIFKEADINKPSFVSAYDTQVRTRYLVHELIEGKKGKLKNMTVTYGNDEVTAVSIEMSEKNTFYSSSTIASMYFSGATFNLDHYSIETTQKIRWMDPNNLKISGVIR